MIAPRPAFRVDGGPVLARRLSRLEDAARAALMVELAAAGEAVADAARAHLDSEARPPVSRTGTLARSVAVEVRGGADAARGEVVVGTPLAYGGWLELGTRRIAAMPWLGPAFRSLAPLLRPRLRTALQRALVRSASGPAR